MKHGARRSRWTRRWAGSAYARDCRPRCAGGSRRFARAGRFARAAAQLRRILEVTLELEELLLVEVPAHEGRREREQPAQHA